jgi:hypothetical protein
MGISTRIACKGPIWSPHQKLRTKEHRCCVRIWSCLKVPSSGGRGFCIKCVCVGLKADATKFGGNNASFAIER